MLTGSHMKTFSRSLGEFATRVVRPLGRLATLSVGFVLMVVGLASAVTIVMLPMGIIVGVLGVGVFVCGVCAPRESTEA